MRICKILEITRTIQYLLMILTFTLARSIPDIGTPLLEAIEDETEAATNEGRFLEVFSFVPCFSINSKPSFIAL